MTILIRVWAGSRWSLKSGNWREFKDWTLHKAVRTLKGNKYGMMQNSGTDNSKYSCYNPWAWKGMGRDQVREARTWSVDASHWPNSTGSWRPSGPSWHRARMEKGGGCIWKARQWLSNNTMRVTKGTFWKRHKRAQFLGEKIDKFDFNQFKTCVIIQFKWQVSGWKKISET